MRLPFWGTILTIIGVCVLCALGFWQLERLAWKTALLDQIAAERAIDAETVSLTPASFDHENILKRGFLAGRYLHDKAIMVAPRTLDGASGFHLITPFVTDAVHGGETVLVNRGWLPVSYERPDDYSLYEPAGVGIVIGSLRVVPKPNMFTPDNVPEKNVWYQISTSDIEVASGLDLLNGILLYVEEERFDDKFGAYPVAVARESRLSNNHAQYVLFWFSVAIAMIGVYCLRFVFVCAKS